MTLNTTSVYRWKYHDYDWLRNEEKPKTYEAIGKYTGRENTEGFPVMRITMGEGLDSYVAADPATIEEIV